MTHADPMNPYAQPAEPEPGRIPIYGQPAQPAWPGAAQGQNPTYGQPPTYGAPPYGSAPGYGGQDAYGYQPGGYAAGGYAGYPYAMGVHPSQLAGWGQRVGASMLDSLLAYAVLILAVIYAMSTGTPGYDAYGSSTTVSTAAGNLAVLVGYAWALGFVIWNRWVRQGRTGQSLGKRAVGIRLVSEATLQPIGGGNAFARDLVHILDGFLDIGYLWPLWDEKKQTFADKIMRSLVVNG